MALNINKYLFAEETKQIDLNLHFMHMLDISLHVQYIFRLQDSSSKTASFQAKGTNSTSFLTYVYKERSGVSTLELGRC